MKSTEFITETLKQVNGKWALVSKSDPKKVLQYYKGSGKPSKDWVSKVEKRVQGFKHMNEENNQEPDENKSKGYVFNIEEETINNTDYRRVMFTSKNNQVVLMSIPPGEEIGAEIHDGAQFIRIEAGSCKTILDGVETDMSDGYVVDVPAGVKHNIINTGDTPLQLYTVYSPPQHEEDLVQKTKPAPDEDDM